MIVLLVTFLAALLCPSVHSQESCNGLSQSPFNIVTASVQESPNLTPFTFTGYDDLSSMTIINKGDSVEAALNADKISVKGGDLPGLYNSALVRFYCNISSSSPGSGHTVDGKQYPMELHILNIHSKYNGNVSAALAANDSTALAVLGFFIEETSEPSSTLSWYWVTSSLMRITKIGSETKELIRLDDLLEGVDRTKYYRYQGSLTTPWCKESVIWTVFKDPIKVFQDWIDLFRTTINFKAQSGSAQTP